MLEVIFLKYYNKVETQVETNIMFYYIKTLRGIVNTDTGLVA